jgi:hypothetical protein
MDEVGGPLDSREGDEKCVQNFWSGNLKGGCHLRALNVI